MRKLSLIPFMIWLAPSVAAADERSNSDAEWAAEILNVVPEGKPKAPNLALTLKPFQLDTLVFDFPSGLRIMFQQDNTSPVVAVTTLLDVGASDDPETEAGMAHVLEHSWFLSSQEGASSVWTLQKSDMGCSLNASTGYDATTYMSVCPSTEMERLLRLNSALIMDPINGVTEEQLATELEVVRNEIRMRTENGNIPGFSIMEFVAKHTFGDGHPYFKPMAGDHTTVRNIQLDKVETWVKEHYKPEKATIMVVGDFDTSDPRDLLSMLYENLDPQMFHPALTEELLAYAPREGIEEPQQDNPDHWWLVAMDPDQPEQMLNLLAQGELPVRSEQYAQFEVTKPANDEFGIYESTVEDPWVVVTWPMPPAYQGQDMLMRMLGFTMNIAINGASYINHKPLEEIDSNIKAWDGCHPQLGKYGTAMVCSATLKDGSKSPEQTAERIINQLYLLNAPEFQHELINMYGRDRMNELARILRSLDLYAAVGSGRATDIARFAHYRGRPDYHSAAMQEVMTIELPTVLGMLSQYITREQSTSFMVKPVDRDDVQSVSGDGSDHYANSNRGAGDTHTVPLETITAELIREKYQGPDFNEMVDITLPNGLRVIVAPHGEAPMALTTLMSRGGDADATDLTGDFVWSFSGMEDTDDPLQIAGTWYNSRNAAHEALTLKGSSGNLDGLLWMLRDGVDNLKPDTAYKKEWLKDLKELAVAELSDVDFHAQDLISLHINPTRFSPQRDFDKIERIASMGAADIQKQLNQRWQPSNTILLIVGDVDPKQAVEQAAIYFGNWQAKGAEAPPSAVELTAPQPVGGQKVLVFDKPGVTQVQVELTCPGYFSGYEAWPEHDVLGTSMGNVITNILREESGVVYSPFVASVASLDHPRVIFSANVQNSASVFALQSYYKLLDQVEAGEFSDITFRYAQLQQANSRAASLQSQDQLHGFLERSLARSNGWDYANNYEARLAAMDIASLQTTLGDCKDNSIATLIGPEELLVAQLTEAGIPHEVIDWKQRGYDMHAAMDPRGAKKAAKKRAKAEKKAKKQAEKAEKKAAKNESSTASK